MLYKFLDSRDVDRVLVGGTLMVSSFEHFRELEATEGDIGDRLEGATEVTVRDGMTVTEGSAELQDLNAANIGLGMFRQFASVEGGGSITIGPGAGFVHVTPALYVYSFAQGELPVLTEQMCRSAPRPYDACLQIKNADSLLRSCLDEGIVKSLDGRRVGDFFHGAAIGPVEYVPRSIDVTEGAAMPPDPFKKAERFRYQSECRFVFRPNEGVQIPSQRLVFAIPDPAAHFELVFRDGLPALDGSLSSPGVR